MTTMPAVVLAAGEGIRLRPLTTYRPKPMLPAVNRPILAHVFDELLACGIEELIVVVGHRRNRIQSHFRSSYRDVPITYRIQDTQLGTGHAVMVADPPTEVPCLVVNGDQIVDRTLIQAVLDGHDGTDATLGVIPGKAIQPYGGAIVEDGRVVDLVDRPTDEREYHLNAGVYVFEPSAIETLSAVEPSDGERSLIDGIARLVAGEGTVGAVSADNAFWADATYPWDILKITTLLFERMATTSDVAESAHVHETAVVRDPVAIGADCVIGPGAVIGPNTALGSNVTVGANAVIVSSVLDADTRIGPNATLNETVTGTGVQIGAGSTVPGGPGDVRIESELFPDESLGAVIADRSKDGGGVDYHPGTVIGPDATISAGSRVSGTLPAETIYGS